MVTIKLNGQVVNLTQSISLELFLEQNDLASQNGIAVALNQTVIQKKEWKKTSLANNDEIIIITATQGG